MDTEDNFFENITDCNEIINSIQSCGINFLAVDFDLTLVGIHTGGKVSFENVSKFLLVY